MNKYTNIEEFEPVELIIAYNVSDVPEEYATLIKKWLGTEEKIEDVWDYGNEIRMMHWEWKNGSDYYLIVDITGFPNNEEQGIVCHKTEIIYENNNQVLTPLIKAPRNKKDLTPESTFLTRKPAFEYIRKLTKDKNPHCIHVMTLYDELLEDLRSEEVSEDEFRSILMEKYEHYSSDDCSGLESSSEDGNTGNQSESFESY